VMLHADPPRVVDYQLAQQDYRGKRESWWFDSTQYFLHCLAHNLRPTPDGEDGLRCLRVLCAMDDSVRDGRPVTVSGDP
jgi:predicted dehydrogenase